MNNPLAKCIKCGEDIPYGVTYTRNPEGTVQHAPGDYCHQVKADVLPCQMCLGVKPWPGPCKNCKDTGIEPVTPSTPLESVGSWEEKFNDMIGGFLGDDEWEPDWEEVREFIRTLLASERVKVERSVLEWVLEHAGRLFGKDIVISENINDSAHIKGFEEGVKYIRSQIKARLAKITKEK